MTQFRSPTGIERNIILAVVGMVEKSRFSECATREEMSAYEKRNKKTIGQMMYETLGHFRVVPAMNDHVARNKIVFWKEEVIREIEAAVQSRKKFENKEENQQ